MKRPGDVVLWMQRQKASCPVRVVVVAVEEQAPVSCTRDAAAGPQPLSWATPSLFPFPAVASGTWGASVHSAKRVATAPGHSQARGKGGILPGKVGREPLRTKGN